jgi:hypothetical protein
MQQKKYQEKVEITQEEYEGTYWTDTAPREQAYTYYLDGRRDIEQIHFTVIETGGGQNRPRKLHITLPVGGANFHVNYFVDNQGRVRPDQYNPDNRTEVRSEVRTQALAYLDAHRASLDEVAQEFKDKVWS